MNDEDEFTLCPCCERCYIVIWVNDGLGGYQFCPMCGYEIGDDF